MDGCFVCMYICVPLVCLPEVHEVRKEALDPLELELQTMWVLGIEPLSF